MPTRVAKLTFFVLFLLTGWMLYRTLRPVFLWVGVGAFCAVLSQGPFGRLLRLFRGRRRTAAAACTFGVVVIVIAPLFFAGWAVLDEALDVASRLSEQAEAAPRRDDGLPRGVPEIARRPIAWLRERIPISNEQLRAGVAAVARRAVAAGSGVVSRAASIGIGLFLWVLSLYYFYVDGARWLDAAVELVPLPRRHSIALMREFRSVSYAVFFGNIVTALAQGVLGGVAFFLVGLSGAVLWGTLIALAGVLPLVGAVLVWGPAAIYLAVSGRPFAALFMLAWGAIVVGSVDNLLRPILTKGQLQMHPLLVFLTLFGGIAAFGFAGILLGPLFAALFLAALRIYAAEFHPRPTPPEAPAPPAPTPLAPVPRPVH